VIRFCPIFWLRDVTWGTGWLFLVGRLRQATQFATRHGGSAANVVKLSKLLRKQQRKEDKADDKAD
jgi:hypothetical protein